MRITPIALRMEIVNVLLVSPGLSILCGSRPVELNLATRARSKRQFR